METGGVVQVNGRWAGRIEDRVSVLEQARVDHEARIKATEKGVSNFNNFQRKTLQHQWFMKGAAAAVVSIATCLWWTVDHAIDKVLPAAKILLQYYDASHPQLQPKMPKISGQDGVSSSQSMDSRNSDH